MIKKIAVLLILLTSGFYGFTQQTPAPSQNESILILGGTAHLGNGDKIEGAAIGFVGGKITFIGSEKNINRKNWQQIIDGTGKHIYPGFIAPNSTLGLQEIGAVRATRDHTEVGTFKPHVRSLISYNTDSEITPTVRSNGILIGQITPRGGVISGTSSIVQFDAWNWEDAVIKEDDGIHLNWPSVFHKHWEKGKSKIIKRKTYDQEKREIDSFFKDAQAYSKLGNHDKTDLKFEAMRGLFDNSKTLYVHANDVKQITEVVNFKKQFGIKKIVLVGAYDAWMVADMIRDNDIWVMIKRPHSVPRYQEDDVDLCYKNAKLLQDEGVVFCLQNAGGMEQMGTRNLPFMAGTCITYGLTYEQAVMALTLNTAMILGIDDTCGSLEIGKDATVFISEGDALDMMTNEVTFAWIQGRQIDLSNRQKELYLKYKAKYDAN